MREKTAHLNLKLPDLPDAEEQMARLFPEYQVKYSALTGIWEIRNNKWVHSLWYNEGKESKLVTKRTGEYRESLILKGSAILLMLALLTIKGKYAWTSGLYWTIIFYGSFFMVIIWADFLVEMWKPAYKAEFEGECSRVSEALASISVGPVHTQQQ